MKSSLLRLSFLFLLLTAGISLQAQDTLRVMTYNILRYGAQGISCTPTSVSNRNTWFTDILARAKADVIGVNEIGPIDNAVAPHVNVSQNILPNIGYGNYEATQIMYEGHQDICNMLWYNADKLGFVKQGLIDVTGTRRDLDFYQLYYKSPGTITDTTYLYIVLVHLMAGSASDRSDQTNAIMNHLATRVGGPNNVIVMGDMNMTSANSGAFQNMVAYNDLDLRMRDPLNLTGTWNNNQNARHSWSQSTPGGAPCASGTALNDRFDLLVCTNAILNGTMGLSYIPGSYYVMGNPHAPNQSVPSQISGSIAAMSDHYPVMMDLQVDQSVSRTRPANFGMKLDIVSPTGNSIKGLVHIPSGHLGTFHLELVDMQGKLIAEKSLQWEAGEQPFEFQINPTQTGIYFLRVSRAGYVPVIKKIAVFSDLNK